MNTQKDHESNASEVKRWTQIRVWFLVIGVWVWFFVDAYRRHSQGESWASAFGFPIDLRFLASFVGGFVIPLVMTMAMLRYAIRLSPSREKTILTKIGWSLFGYLFIWSVFLTYFLYPY